MSSDEEKLSQWLKKAISLSTRIGLTGKPLGWTRRSDGSVCCQSSWPGSSLARNYCKRRCRSWPLVRRSQSSSACFIFLRAQKKHAQPSVCMLFCNSRVSNSRIGKWNSQNHFIKWRLLLKPNSCRICDCHRDVSWGHVLIQLPPSGSARTAPDDALLCWFIISEKRPSTHASYTNTLL